VGTGIYLDLGFDQQISPLYVEKGTPIGPGRLGFNAFARVLPFAPSPFRRDRRTRTIGVPDRGRQAADERTVRERDKLPGRSEMAAPFPVGDGLLVRAFMGPGECHAPKAVAGGFGRIETTPVEGIERSSLPRTMRRTRHAIDGLRLFRVA